MLRPRGGAPPREPPRSRPQKVFPRNQKPGYAIVIFIIILIGIFGKLPQISGLRRIIKILSRLSINRPPNIWRTTLNRKILHALLHIFSLHMTIWQKHSHRDNMKIDLLAHFINSYRLINKICYKLRVCAIKSMEIRKF